MDPPTQSLRRDPAAAGRNKDQPQMNADIGREDFNSRKRAQRAQKKEKKNLTQRRKVKAESKLFTGGHDGPVRKHV
jgi:hypothetical protein